MKIIDDVSWESGMIITAYESTDQSKPPCGEYCEMKFGLCVFCGKLFGYSKEDEGCDLIRH